METKKVLLSEDEIPRQWYNILADIKMNPPLGPDGNPISPDMLAPVFPMNLIEQEVSSERWIDIPEEVLRVLNIWRPSPLVRAYELEKALDTPARILARKRRTFIDVVRARLAFPTTSARTRVRAVSRVTNTTILARRFSAVVHRRCAI